MSHAIEFIETSLFTRQIKTIATDSELRDLQSELIESPNKGDLIKERVACERLGWRPVTKVKVAAPE